MTKQNIIKKIISKDGICEITLINPDRRNPLSLQLINELQIELNILKKR